ncbi:MAG: FAD-dependent oxidoreductase [Thermodesulfobacteriota bacterium]
MANPLPFIGEFNNVEMFRYCEQCGRCSSACPITGKEGFNIRRLLRHVELELIDAIAGSKMPWDCAVCFRCEDACPNGIKIVDITRTLRALGPAESIPSTPPCVNACPAGIDVPGYLRLIGEGKMEEACELIMEQAPFPGILGRICPHPCEKTCKRGEVNEPIAICAAKRYAEDHAAGLFEKILSVPKETGKRVAVIGSGPAGLSAGFYLRKKGHQVSVFEAREKPGGMMRYGIPRYRLPEAVLDREINRIMRMGIVLQTGQKLGVDFEIEALKEKGFDAVFVAVGAQLSRRLNIEGVELANLFWGVEFLGLVSRGEAPEIKERILVVGGGSVALDVALTVLRLGGKQVMLACLESRDEMPANPWEIETALEEGVEMLYSWGPSKIIGSHGSVSGIELVRCTSVFDENGNFCPFFDETKKRIEVDQVILAIGQASETAFCDDFCFLEDEGKLPVNNGLILIDRKSQETPLRGVFAGGDAANGPATVIEAIAAGRRAACSIDRFLGGDGRFVFDADQKSIRNDSNSGALDKKRKFGFAELRREVPPVLPVSERKMTFTEVDQSFSDEQVKREVDRCLQCDLEARMIKNQMS